MGMRKRRPRRDDSSSTDASSSDGMSTEETRSARSSRKTRSKEANKGAKRMFAELKDEFKRMFEELKDELKDETSGMKKELKELINENHIELCRRLEQLNGSSGDISPAPREPNQMQLPRFQLKITSKVKDKVGKGESILTEHGDPINIVLYDGGNEIANDHPLASASVMMVVLNGEFNKDDIKYNWSKEDFQKSIRRPREGNSATGDVNKIIESTVSGGTFNLAGGKCSHRDAKISENSSNKKVRLGVMIVSQTEERVLEGLSNHFLVRDPPKKSKSARVDGSSTLGNNTEQATISSTPGDSTHRAHLQCLQQPSSCTEGGQFPATNTMNPHALLYDPNGVHSSTISNIRSTPMYSPPTGFGNCVADLEQNLLGFDAAASAISIAPLNCIAPGFGDLLADLEDGSPLPDDPLLPPPPRRTYRMSNMSGLFSLPPTASEDGSPLPDDPLLPPRPRRTCRLSNMSGLFSLPPTASEDGSPLPDDPLLPPPPRWIQDLDPAPGPRKRSYSLRSRLRPQGGLAVTRLFSPPPTALEDGSPLPDDPLLPPPPCGIQDLAPAPRPRPTSFSSRIRPRARGGLAVTRSSSPPLTRARLRRLLVKTSPDPAGPNDTAAVPNM